MTPTTLVFILLAAEPLLIPVPSRVLEHPLWDNRDNRPPVVRTQRSVAVAPGTRLELPVRVSDPDGDALHVFARNLPPGATFDGSTLRWNPGRVNTGYARDVTIVATDGRSYDLQTFVVQVARAHHTNRAPVVRAPRHVKATAGYETLIELGATDPDGDRLRYRFQTHSGDLGAASRPGLPAGASFDPSTGYLSWRPECGEGGRHHITVFAYDLVLGGKTRQASRTIVVDVERPVNVYARSVVGRWKVVVPAAQEPGVPEMITFQRDGSVQRHETEYVGYARRRTRDGAGIRVTELASTRLVAFDGERRLELARCEDGRCRELSPRACTD